MSNDFDLALIRSLYFSSHGWENPNMQFDCPVLLVTNINNDNTDKGEVMGTFLSL